MSHSFKLSSGKKAFGVFSEPLEAGDYINKKKAKTINCNKKCNVYCEKTINNANLNINLITELDLTDVSVISNVNTDVSPTPFLPTDVPYLDYNIDPSGNLFGNTICGINNYVNYMVYTYPTRQI
jgi:hypothetical protein